MVSIPAALVSGYSAQRPIAKQIDNASALGCIAPVNIASAKYAGNHSDTLNPLSISNKNTQRHEH